MLDLTVGQGERGWISNFGISLLIAAVPGMPRLCDSYYLSILHVINKF